METQMCECDFGEGEPIYPRTIEQRVAKKAHVCGECGEPIKVGDSYENIKGKCEGDWFEHKTCVPCQHIRDNFCSPLGCLRDILYEKLGFDYVTGHENPDFEGDAA